MIRGKLPGSDLDNNMIKMPSPCGKHHIYYPVVLALDALRRNEYHIFATSCECGTAYLVATLQDGAHVVLFGSQLAIMEKYERLPFKEKIIADRNGMISCKEMNGTRTSEDVIKKIAELLK